MTLIKVLLVVYGATTNPVVLETWDNSYGNQYKYPDKTIEVCAKTAKETKSFADGVPFGDVGGIRLACVPIWDTDSDDYPE